MALPRPARQANALGQGHRRPRRRGTAHRRPGDDAHRAHRPARHHRGIHRRAPLGLQGATIALAGAVVLMIVSKDDVHEILKTVEWSSLFCFIGLFIVVGAVVKAGLIRDLATATLGITGGRTDIAALLVLWMSA